MGKRIELTEVYRPGRSPSPASAGSAGTPVRAKSVTPARKRPKSMGGEVGMAGPTAVSSARVGTLEVGEGDSGSELDRLRALVARYEAKWAEQQTRTLERVRKHREKKAKGEET